MAERSPSALVLHLALAVLGTLAFALAMGAVWMALMMRYPGAHLWFAPVVALLLGYGIRHWFLPSRLGATLLAGLGMLIAATYMQCILVGLQLAAVMGLGKIEAMVRAGSDMLLALAWSTADATAIKVLLASMALAMWSAGRRPDKAELKRHPAP